MLALSRRPGQRILFPDLDISVEILQVKGNSVKVGVNAPPHVVILREEVAARAERSALAERPQGVQREAKAAGPGGGLNHTQRNRLNTAALALHVVEKQLQAGLIGNAETTLQCAIKILESVESPAPQRDHAAGSGANPRNIAALVVEDDPVEESLLTGFLRLSGFHVETVRDGYEALEYLANRPRPDFVLMDMHLPRLNGAATISAIRGNPQLCDLRIFAVTGLSPEETGVVLGPGGVDRWFQKPLNPSRIAEAMSAAALN